MQVYIYIYIYVPTDDKAKDYDMGSSVEQDLPSSSSGKGVWKALRGGDFIHPIIAVLLQL